MVSRQRIAAAVKIGVSAACLVLAWRAFAPTDWGDVLKTLDLRFAVAAIAALIVGQVANGFRHWAVLHGLRRHLPPGTVVALSSAGMFFNQVLPSGMGGDVVRVLHLGRRCGWRRATASVLLDRVVGVAFNLALVAVLLPSYLRLDIPDVAKAGIALLALGPLIGLALGLWAARWRRLRRLLPRPLRLLPYGLVLLRQVVRPAGLVRLALPVAVGFFAYVAGFGLIGTGLGAGTTIVGYLMMVPLIFIAVQIPLSFGGWGIREGAAATLMPLVGMDQGLAFLTSFLFGVAVLVTSLPGLAVWMIAGLGRTADAAGALPTAGR